MFYGSICPKKGRKDLAVQIKETLYGEYRDGYTVIHCIGSRVLWVAKAGSNDLQRNPDSVMLMADARLRGVIVKAS